LIAAFARQLLDAGPVIHRAGLRISAGGVDMLVITIALRSFSFLDFALLSSLITAGKLFALIDRRRITLTTYTNWYYILR
jgi:hypothetical protein